MPEYAKQHKIIHFKFVLQTLYFVNRKKHGRINLDSSMPKGQQTFLSTNSYARQQCLLRHLTSITISCCLPHLLFSLFLSYSSFYSNKNCILTSRVRLLPFQNHAFSLQQCSHKPYPIFSLHVGFLLGKPLRESRLWHITLFLIPNNTKLAYPTFLWHLLSSLLFKSSDSTQGHFISSDTNAFNLYLDAYVFFPYFSKSAFTHHDTTKQTYLPAPCLTKLSLYI